jgi:transposase InsO family protein
MESFFHTLKTELVHYRDYQTRSEVRRDIFEFIEIFYNRQRSHSTLGYLTQPSSRSLPLAARTNKGIRQTG